MNKTKLLGQTFTEYREVEKMFSMCKKDILDIKVLEPSFGDGQFLMHIVRCIIKQGRLRKFSDKDISKILNNNIFGYELDSKFFKIAKVNLKSVLEDCDFKEKVSFNKLVNDSIFKLKHKDFDLIIGNPPYVRVQNFSEGIEEQRHICKRTSGNTDLYLLFIDFLLNFLNKNGNLIFIIPNSFGKSKAAYQLREHMIKNGSLTYIDFEDKQLFAKASVYSCIIDYKKNANDDSYFKVGYKSKKMKMVHEKYFLPKDSLHRQNINIEVKNGIATLADSIFIFDADKVPPKFEKDFLYKTYKGSRQDKEYLTIFPYEIRKGKILKLNEKDFMEKAPNIFKHLKKHKEKLLSRNLDSNAQWFEFGRSQALKDVSKPKILIDTLIKPNQQELKYKKLGKNTIVFSGLYTTDKSFIIKNDANLIKSLRFKAKDMRGGYKKISSSLLKHEKHI